MLGRMTSLWATDELNADHPGVVCSISCRPKDALSPVDNLDSNQAKSSERIESLTC